MLSQLSFVNFLLLVFNLLLAFPLDGGKVLEAWLWPVTGATWAVRGVAGVGLLVAVWLVLQALSTNSIFMILLGVLIGLANWQALQSTLSRR